jgi:hypothetical protein
MKPTYFFISLLFLISGGLPSAVAQSTEKDAPVAMFLSDFHIGEIYGSVTRHIPQGKASEYDSILVTPRIYYHKRVITLLQNVDKALGDKQSMPYLILVGDIFDIAVHEASDVYNLSQTFFSYPIYKGRSFISFFDTIIFIPGNHDHHTWTLLQESYYIHEPLLNSQQALPFPHQIISVLSIGKSLSFRCEDTLFTYNPRHNFLSAIVSKGSKAVYVAYPNLYIACPDKQAICVTHGHFFEPQWNKDTILSVLAKPKYHPYFFHTIEKYNAPFTEFSDYGIAQVNDTFTSRLSDCGFQNDTIYQKIAMELATTFPLFFPLEIEAQPLTDMEKLKNHPKQVFPYMYHSIVQMETRGMHLSKMVYGHTHIPCFDLLCTLNDFNDNSLRIPEQYLRTSFRLYNTGGWVNLTVPLKESMDNTTQHTPNPMFLYRNGDIEKVFAE